MELGLPEKNWQRMLLGLSMIILIGLATWFIGYLMGMEDICERNGAVLAKDKDGLTCLLPEQIGKTCFDNDDSTLQDYKDSMGIGWIDNDDS